MTLRTVSAESTAVWHWVVKRLGSHFSWLHQFFDGPSSIMSPIHCLWSNPDYFGPLCQGKRTALIRNFPTIAFIVALFFLSSPATIFFAIRALRINSVYAFPWWANSHILQEIREIKPSFANRDASSTIIFIGSRFRIIASLQNPSPNHIRACASQPMFNSWLRFDTSARFAISIPQASGLDRDFFPTDTPTEPLHFPRNTSDGRPIGKLFAWGNKFSRRARQPASFVSVVCTHVLYNIRMSV
jgi:hypothetical protein